MSSATKNLFVDSPGDMMDKRRRWMRAPIGHHFRMAPIKTAANDGPQLRRILQDGVSSIGFLFLWIAVLYGVSLAVFMAFAAFARVVF